MEIMMKSVFVDFSEIKKHIFKFIQKVMFNELFYYYSEILISSALTF